MSDAGVGSNEIDYRHAMAEHAEAIIAAIDNLGLEALKAQQDHIESLKRHNEVLTVLLERLTAAKEEEEPERQKKHL